MLNKIMSAKDAVGRINDGSSIIVSGFCAVGSPDDIIDEIIAQEIKDLTVIANDGGTPITGVGKLLYAGKIKKFVCSWCGFTPIVARLVDENGMEMEFNPQGTVVERIRAGGCGLGGVLTKTGLGTVVEEKGWGKRIEIEGEEWLFHTPLRGDVALIEAYQADEAGNLVFNRTQLNYAEIASMAAGLVIASVVKPILKIGELDPDHIRVPGALVDILVQQDERYMEQPKYLNPTILDAIKKANQEFKVEVQKQ